MASEKSFEQSAIHDFQDDGEPGRAPPAEDFELGSKKTRQEYARDVKMDEKVDHPPRFSTLFGTAPLPPPPPPPPVPSAPVHQNYVREYYPKPEKKRGIYMPLSLFIVFMVIVFFESTILFAYTIIGLYNNAPSRMFPWAGPGTVAATCDMTPQQPAINVAPNFMLSPQPAAAITELITVTAPAKSEPTSQASTTSSAQAAAAASNIADILGGLGSSSSRSVVLVTVGGERSTVTSVKLITEAASTSAPRPTVTLTTFVDPPKSTA